MDGERSRDAMQPPSKWYHRAGHYCFPLNASQTAENPNIYFPD
jgi:hypothetical protein